MINIEAKTPILDQYHKIIKCWLLRKFDGPLNRKSGYSCGDLKCKICIKKIQKFKGLPLNVVVFFKKNIDTLIIGKPSELLELNKNYKKIKINKKHRKNINEFFIETGYKNWFQKEFAKDFLSDLNINTCVYCNRNYTLDIVNTHTRAELDHWFPKVRFSFLALSLQNLIPSCHSCNHIKGNPNYDWENALDMMNHPYSMEENEDFIFSYEFDKNLNSLKVKTKINTKSKKMTETLKFNKTLDMYNAHANFELKDLYDLRVKYPDKFFDILKDNFGGIMGKEEAYRIIYGIELSEEKYLNRPFSKFKKDIIDELLSIK